MGFVIGAIVGLGLLCAMRAVWDPRPLAVSPRVREMMTRIIVPAAVGWCTVTAIAGLVTGSLPISLVMGSFGALIPPIVSERRRRRRALELREAWPEVLDHVVGSLRSGLSVAESLASLSRKGPPVVREHFSAFADAVRAHGRVDVAIDELKASLADPMADRLLEAMRIAHRLGGRDLSAMLSQLASLVREDNRARGELEARQSWTVNGARIAAAAPWLMLLLLSTRPGTVDAFSSGAGVMVLAGGAVLTIVAYALMIRLGRLPADRRIFIREAAGG